MPRVRAADYDAKAQGIMDCAAVLFARTGYPNAKMQDIARACEASKSMLYHYFPTKEDLLFSMLREHLEDLIAAIQGSGREAKSPAESLRSFVRVYTQRSAQARRRHIVAMNDVKFLPVSRQSPLLDLERKVIGLLSGLLRQLNPCLHRALYKPYALLLIGMLNWTETWYRPKGTIRPQELSDRIWRLFLRGFLAES